MWYPPPPVLVPCYLENFSLRPSHMPTTMMWQIIPFDQQLYLATNGMVGYEDKPLSVEDGRKFLLNKSVFDLVKVSHFLELTDPKLLGWYLSLPSEDRKLIQEGGGFFQFLQRHPALEVTRHFVRLKRQVLGDQYSLPKTDMSSNLNKSRHPTFYGASRCVNCGTSSPSGAKKCRRCNTSTLNAEKVVSVSEEDKSLDLLPNSVKEEPNLLKAKRHEACQDQWVMGSTKAQYFSEMWEQCVWNERADKDPLAPADFSLDMELEMQGHAQKSDQDQVYALVDASADLNQETSPEYYSLNSSRLERTSAKWSDTTESGRGESLMANKGSAEVSAVDEPVQNAAASGFANCRFPDSVSCNSSEWTDYTDDYQDLGIEDNSMTPHEYHGVFDEGLLSSGALSSNCSSSGLGSGFKQHVSESMSVSEESFLSVGQSVLSIESTSPCQNCEGTHAPLSVSKAVDATSDFRSCFTATQATEIGPNIFLKSCRDIAVGTDSFTINCEEQTHALQTSTSEKCSITVVHMSDLDVLAEEFEYLKKVEKELKKLKDKMASSGFAGEPGSTGQRSNCGCDAVHRARLAELRLLALQFAMCKQHCWRQFYTSPLGEAVFQGTKALPDILSQTLKTLEDDYLEMKRKVLAGIHLDDLEPLSVDTCKIPTGTCYSPALVFEACLGVPSKESTSASNPDAGDQFDQASKVFNMESIDGAFLRKATPPQDNVATSSESKGVNSKLCRALCVLSQQSRISSDKPGILKDPSSSETWFDAEEGFGCDQYCKEEKQTGQSWCKDTKMDHKGGDRNEDQSFLLRVTDLPSNVTECDLLLWFKRYHASQVNIIALKDRAAIVIVRSPSNAETAVRELNGQSIQGHTVHVEHIHGSPAGNQGPIKALGAEHFPAAYKARPVGEELHSHGSKNYFQHFRPLRCSLDRLINIQDKPTASGTCVPQHYATMGSFDTLMARLSERHPKMSRKRLVGALLELQAKHQGFLSGLPLRAIADMTSDLLSQQSITK